MQRKISFRIVLCLFPFVLFAQEKSGYQTTQGHTGDSPFDQIYDLLPTPNGFRTAAGAPGHAYYQQQADYVMDLVLDESNNILHGEETITYTNHSPDVLDYLWVQLEQNIRRQDSPMHGISQRAAPQNPVDVHEFAKTFMYKTFDGGYQIHFVKDAKGEDLPHFINETMMRVVPSKPIGPNETFVFKIKWSYSIPNFFEVGDRNGYEPHENGNIYAMAQFYPRMAVYNDVEGWQNMQYRYRSEYTLPFGDFKVNITVPADHIMNATGTLTNVQEILTKEQYQRYQKAKTTFENPIMVVTEDETDRRMAAGSKGKTKVWTFEAENVRDFAFATSRTYMWDAMAVQVGAYTPMAESVYPKEGGDLWKDLSTKAVAHTLKWYSHYTFDYPYPKAVSASVQRQGMEYPMISFNGYRANSDGSYGDEQKYGLISLIIHEVGHNFFPMIVNSDERQWTWMDEGLNVYLQILAEQEWEADYPSRRGKAVQIVPYMQSKQEDMMPIMTQGDLLKQFGNEGYSKPAAGLHILRNTIVGKENFDYAFKTYARRWMFKHPQPADFFRTLDDASGTDLDWFIRGWFFSTEVVDLGVRNIVRLYPQEVETEDGKRIGFSNQPVSGDIYRSNILKEYLSQNNGTEIYGTPWYFYEVEYEKIGGMLMPLLVEFTFEDGSTKEVRYPVEVWRFAPESLKKFYGFEKPLKSITIDKYQETADVNESNHFLEVKS
ncbi:MAG: M1 family metallopeptidase [Moheibacter sp.]